MRIDYIINKLIKDLTLAEMNLERENFDKKNEDQLYPKYWLFFAK